MNYVFSCLILLATIGMCSGQDDCPTGELYYTILAPEGWNIVGLGCCGIYASDSENPARGIVVLNHLHQGIYMLPPYTTPETYVESYMPQDFSLGSNQVTDMKFLFYEDDQDIANAFASYSGLSSGKSMRCSFAVNGIPAEGSFTAVTRELMGYGTTVDFLAGIYAPSDQFDMDVSNLIDVIKSIQLITYYRNVCLPSPSCLSWQYKCDDMCCNWPCNEENRCY